jgi:hypothetical protein
MRKRYSVLVSYRYLPVGHHIFLYKVKVKVKLSLCFNRAPRHEGVLGEWRYSSMHSLSSALDGREWSALRPGRFTPRERAPGTHWIEGCIRNGNKIMTSELSGGSRC